VALSLLGLVACGGGALEGRGDGGEVVAVGDGGDVAEVAGDGEVAGEDGEVREVAEGDGEVREVAEGDGVDVDVESVADGEDAGGDGEDAGGDGEDAGGDGEDAGGDGEDAGGDGEADAGADVDVAGPCAAGAGAACLLTGFVPPCYEGRCNTQGTCVPARIPDCCRGDADCPPDGAAGACEASRCVAALCTLVRVPGCCADDPTVCTAGACDPEAGRCAWCPEADCAGAAPIYEQRFDVSPWPLAVTDYQAADLVGWGIDARRSASGAAAGYLGNLRCRTYYGGALDAACEPAADGEQDSARVQVVTRTPFFALPADAPALASLWVWSEVEPSLGRGETEPDLLKVRVEASDQNLPWLVATTLDVGKSTGGAWRALLVDLAPWAGKSVRLLFEFDTYDGEDNRYEGVWIDELVVTRACAGGGCCAADLDCPAAPSACEATRCLPASSGTGGRCVVGPLTPGAPCVACASAAACDDGDPCTADACDGGRCEHTRFCCLERDVFELVPARDGTGALAMADEDASDGVTWQLFEGALAFVDQARGVYASSPPGKRVAGAFTTAAFTLPEDGVALGAELELTLSTEWDTWSGSTFTNPAGLDRLSVSVVDQALVREVWSSDEIAGTTLGTPTIVSLDLAPWRGRSVALRVRFDSGDADDNDHAGARITRLHAGARCGAEPPL